MSWGICYVLISSGVLYVCPTWPNSNVWFSNMSLAKLKTSKSNAILVFLSAIRNNISFFCFLMLYYQRAPIYLKALVLILWENLGIQCSLIVKIECTKLSEYRLEYCLVYSPRGYSNKPQRKICEHTAVANNSLKVYWYLRFLYSIFIWFVCLLISHKMCQVTCVYLRSGSMNRLGSELSPYLRQHKDNPVHWYPWGQEAIQR